MRYVERRAKGQRRVWEVIDTRKGRVVRTGLRLWEAAHRADRLNQLAAKGLVTA